MSAHQNQQDLYNILNIPRNASQSQIKSAYRKLALKYHPDKQSSEEEKAKCTEIFTKIGNAYEVLGDPQRREAYDRYGTTDANVSNSGMPTGTPYQQQQQQQQNPFTGGFFRGADPFQDPFFTGRRGGRSAGFTDPFDLFQQMFGAEFGHQFHNEDYARTGRNYDSNGAGRAGAGSFGNFGVGGLGGMMGQHMNAMNNMMNVNVQSSFSSNTVGNHNGGFRTFSSTSTSFGGGGNGVRESVSTSTRIINGKRQTVTERVKVHSDGRVERSTETTGDDDFPSGYLGNGGNNSGHGQCQSLDQQRSNSRSWR